MWQTPSVNKKTIKGMEMKGWINIQIKILKFYFFFYIVAMFRIYYSDIQLD